MNRHKLNRNEFRLENGAIVNIEYWVNSAKVHVAAFGADGHQISRASYQAAVDTADELNPRLQESLVNSLANALEYDLINYPDMHIRTH